MRRVVRAVVRPLVVGASGALVAWAVGVEAGSAALLGLALAVVVLVVERVEPDPDVRPAHEHQPRRHGARGEVQDLAWAMVARDRRVGERAHRVLRQTAAVRLARHGVRLGDPEHDAALRDLVGERAHRTLTRTSLPMPRVADVRHTVDVLERLGPARTLPATTTAATGAPEHQATDSRPADPPPADTRPTAPRSPRRTVR